MPAGAGLTIVLVRPMTSFVKIAPLIVRIARCDPVTMPVARVGVISADPDVLSVPPFVVTGNPDSRMIWTLPLRVILPRWWWPLHADLNTENGICRCRTASCQP